jgi:hypothetical protein
MERVAGWIVAVLQNVDDAALHKRIETEVRELCEAFPVPGHSSLIGDELALPVGVSDDPVIEDPSPS